MESTWYCLVPELYNPTKHVSEMARNAEKSHVIMKICKCMSFLIRPAETLSLC